MGDPYGDKYGGDKYGGKGSGYDVDKYGGGKAFDVSQKDGAYSGGGAYKSDGGGGKGAYSTSSYKDNGYKNNETKDQYDKGGYTDSGYSDSGYADSGYRPTTMPKEKKYMVFTTVRELNDHVQSASDPNSDISGRPFLTENDIREIGWKMRRYIGVYAITMLLASIPVFLMFTMVGNFFKFVIPLFMIAGFAGHMAATSFYVIEGEQFVLSELGNVTFRIYEEYAAKWRGFVSFAIAYLAFLSIAITLMTIRFEVVLWPLYLNKYGGLVADWIKSKNVLTILDLFVYLVAMAMMVGFIRLFLADKAKETEIKRLENLRLMREGTNFRVVENARDSLFNPK